MKDDRCRLASHPEHSQGLAWCLVASVLHWVTRAWTGTLERQGHSKLPGPMRTIPGHTSTLDGTNSGHNHCQRLSVGNVLEAEGDNELQAAFNVSASVHYRPFFHATITNILPATRVTSLTATSSPRLTSTPSLGYHIQAAFTVAIMSKIASARGHQELRGVAN